MLKKMLKITGILLLVVLVVLFAAPFLFKGKIVAIVKEEINKNIHAKADFKDVSLSFFRHFPKVSLALEELQVVGLDEFAADTLISAKEIDVAVDLMSIIRGKEMKVYAVNIDAPRIHAIVNKAGKANWDIMKEDVEESNPSQEPSAPFQLQLQQYAITNGYIKYTDASSGMSSEIEDLNHKGSGDFTSDLFTLKTSTNAAAVSFTYGGIPYLIRTKTDIGTSIQVDNKTNKYSFKTDEVAINDLKLATEGFFQLVNDSTYNMDIQFKAPSTDFKNILSLIPAVYQQDFSKIKATGKALFDGFVKGTYSSKQIPAYAINIGIEDGFFQYPDLPKAVKNINIQAKVNNPDGVTDHTVVDIAKGHIEFGNDPFDFRLLLKNPVTSQYIDAAVKGKLDLAGVTQFVKLEPDTKLAGIINADVQAKGNVATLQQSTLDNFNAQGSVDVTNLLYASKDYPDGVQIHKGELSFNPKNVNLNTLNGNFMQTNFTANGSFNNLFGYALHNEPLAGTLNVTADKVDLNKWMGTTATTAADSAKTATANTTVPFAVPANIQFTLNTKVDQVQYDKVDYNNITGTLDIKDETVTLKNMQMQALDGTIGLNGSYSTAVSKTKPAITLAYDVKDLDVQKTFYAFNTVQKLMPVGKFIAGKLASKLTLKGNLGGDMMPDLSTLTGEGTLFLIQGFLSKFQPLDKLASSLNIKELQQVSLKDIKNYFEFANGKVLVKPFTVKIKDIEMQIGGMHGLDQSIDYIVNMKLPRALIGTQGNNLINNLVTQANSKGIPVNVGETINLNVLMGGTITNPAIKTDLKEAAGNAADQMKQQALAFAQAKVDSAKKAVTTAAKDTLASIKKQALQSAADELKKQISGTKDTANKQDPKKGLESSAKGLLEGLFKKKKAAADSAKQ